MEEKEDFNSGLTYESIDRQISLGGKSYIHYWFYFRFWTVWIFGNIAITAIPAYQIISEGGIVSLFIWLQFIAIIIVNFFCLYLLIDGGLRQALTKGVFYHKISKSETMNDLVKNFFEYKKARGKLTQKEVDGIVATHYRLLGEDFSSQDLKHFLDRQDVLAKTIPRYPELLSWVLKNKSLKPTN